MKSGLKGDDKGSWIPLFASSLNLYRDEKRTERNLRMRTWVKKKVSTYTAMKSGLKVSDDLLKQET